MRYWGRDYRLTVGVGSKAVIVEPPFRMSFTADKTISVALNKAKISVWGLQQSTRLKLVKDEWSKDYFPIQLEVGYEGKIESVFKGSVRSGEFARDGADFVSTLDCFDGGFDTINSFTNTVASGKKQAIESALADMPNTALGMITKAGDLIRPRILVGNSTALIEGLLDEDDEFFIDDEQLYVIKAADTRSNFAPLVSAKTGLLNTPVVSKGKLTFDTILNPTLKIAGLCKVESKFNPNVNGVYRIEQMTYSGDTHGGDWKQSVLARLAR